MLFAALWKKNHVVEIVRISRMLVSTGYFTLFSEVLTEVLWADYRRSAFSRGRDTHFLTGPLALCERSVLQTQLPVLETAKV